jgi:hypothetical protein
MREKCNEVACASASADSICILLVRSCGNRPDQVWCRNARQEVALGTAPTQCGRFGVTCSIELKISSSAMFTKFTLQ